METIANTIITVFIFVFGASIGSFLNVVVYRLPAKLSLLWPPSRCPHCLHQLGTTENIPVFGWLWLRGRCRWCQAPISMRYPLVEAATGGIFLLVFWQFDFTLTTVGYWAFLSWLLALSLIDLDTMTLPNPLTQSGLLLGLLFQAVIGWQERQLTGVAIHLMAGIFGAVLGIWLLDTIALLGTLALGREAMGAGDAKLMATIGAWLGWKYMLLSGFLACAIGAFAGGGALAVGLCGKDGNLITARHVGKEGIGFVGEVSSVNIKLVKSLVQSGYVPIISSVAADENGQAHNINADTAAGEIAAALDAEKLILLTDTPGILEDYRDPTTLLTKLQIQQARKLIDRGIVGGGMIPKVECCVRSLAQGVRAAHIIDGRIAHALLLEIFTDDGIGSMIVP